jgi:hypothetical protein
MSKYPNNKDNIEVSAISIVGNKDFSTSIPYKIIEAIHNGVVIIEYKADDLNNPIVSSDEKILIMVKIRLLSIVPVNNNGRDCTLKSINNSISGKTNMIGMILIIQWAIILAKIIVVSSMANNLS